MLLCRILASLITLLRSLDNSLWNYIIGLRSLLMSTVTLSNEYQLIIPKDISESIGIEPGSSFEVLSYNNRIELIPIKPINKLKGIFKGIDTNISRDDDRV
jgi:AbrB family looped-hinge helix DNA binding protein